MVNDTSLKTGRHGKAMRLAKFEYRNPKFEINSKTQIQMPKTNANPFWVDFCFKFLSIEFLDCFGFRASDFESAIPSHFDQELSISILS